MTLLRLTHSASLTGYCQDSLVRRRHRPLAAERAMRPNCGEPLKPPGTNPPRKRGGCRIWTAGSVTIRRMNQWAIRSQAPEGSAPGEGSTTGRTWVPGPRPVLMVQSARPERGVSGKGRAGPRTWEALLDFGLRPPVRAGVSEQQRRTSEPNASSSN